MAGPGRRPEDAAAQADLALTNLATLLREAGSDMDDVCKITVYISDRAYRGAVYPVIGRHFRGSIRSHRADRGGSPAAAIFVFVLGLNLLVQSTPAGLLSSQLGTSELRSPKSEA